MMSTTDQETSSPPHKKTKSENKSPHELFFEDLEAVLEKNNGIGQMLVRGIAMDEDEEEEEEDTSKYTTEQMKYLRFIAITQVRPGKLVLFSFLKCISPFLTSRSLPGPCGYSRRNGQAHLGRPVRSILYDV